MQVHVRMGDEHKILYGVSFLVLGIAAFWYFSVYDRPVTNEQDFTLDDNAPVVVAFGDSLVEGVGAKKSGGFVSILESESGLEIINMGKSGDTTKDAWDRVSSVTRLDPDVVVLSIGGNDFLTRQPKEQTTVQLERVVTELHRSGAAVILLEVPGFYGMHRSVARDYNTSYVPNILSGLLGKEEYMFDAVHPNDKGYNVIAQKVLPNLLKLTD